MKQLLTTTLILASMFSMQAVKADDTNQTVVNQVSANQASISQTTAPAPLPIVISWDRVGGKEKWWV